MLEVADIVRLHGADYRKQYGATLTPCRNRALRDIAACRTPFCGGHIYQCDHCQEKIFSYHSCGNRSCPKCHQNQTERWLTQQRSRLLPCSYFLLTFTLPAPLRPLARSHPKQVYGLLMKAAAEALQAIAADPLFVGAPIGALAVLHTWTRAMLFHPHVHMLVTAGGLSTDGHSWVDSKHSQFLVPVRALSILFRAKFCDGLKKRGLLRFAPSAVWKQGWVVHSQHAGRGDKVLEYLGRYVFRIAIANSRIDSRHRVHPPLSSTRPAQRLHQSPLLRHLQPCLPLPARLRPPTAHFNSAPNRFDRRRPRFTRLPVPFNFNANPDALPPLPNRRSHPAGDLAVAPEPLSMRRHQPDSPSRAHSRGRLRRCVSAWRLHLSLQSFSPKTSLLFLPRSTSHSTTLTEISISSTFPLTATRRNPIS
jgi:hypothetical protein